MNQNSFFILILTVVTGFLLYTPAFPIEGTKPEGHYLNILVTENNAVYGVTDQRTGDGKYVPVELTGEEKIKVVLNEFAMKDDVTIEMLKPGGENNYIVDILQTEKKIAIDILKNYLKDKNSLNREKASYVLDIIKNTAP